MPSSYGWVVTRDHVNDDKGRVGTFGPRDIPADIHAALKSEKPGKFGKIHKWKTWDSDKNPIYSGLFIGDADSEEGFAPLEDFAGPDAGATDISYWENGRWAPL